MSIDRRRVIRDPIHEYVEVPQRLDPILAHPLLQRLRRVGQTSLTAGVYPSATGSRFEHSLGTMHLARLATQALFKNSPEIMEQLADCAGREFPGINAGERNRVLIDAVGAVGLTHDLGHPPFSHALESAFSTLASQFSWFAELPAPFADFAEVTSAFHEVATVHLLHKLLDDLRVISEIEGDERAENKAFYDLVMRIASSDPDKDDWAGTLHGIVAGELDVDRLDYVMRDAQRAGTEFGSVDHVRLISSSEIVLEAETGPRFRLGFGARARSSAETLLIQRAQSYRWIVFHHRVISGNEALRRAFNGLVQLKTSSRQIRNNEGELEQLGDFFDLDVEQLNYVNSPVKVLGGQLSLEGENLSPQSLAMVWTARVDDGFIVSKIYGGMIAADHLLQEITTQEISEKSPPSRSEEVAARSKVRDELQQFRAYARAALLREKRLHPTWKTIDEQRRVTDSELRRPQLREAITEQLELLIKEFAGTSADLYVRRAGFDVLSDLFSEERSQLGLNAVFDEVLGAAAYREKFEKILLKNTPSNFRPNSSWAVVYSPWSSLRSQGRTATMFVGARPESIRVGSPLIDAMASADARRLSTMAFYVTHYIGENRDLVDREIYKNTARTVFKRSIAELFTRVWLPAIEAKARVLNGGESLPKP